MHPLAEQEGPAWPLDLELPPQTPGAPAIHDHHNSSTLTGPRDNPRESDDTTLKEDRRPDSINLNVRDTSFKNVEDEGKTQDAGLSKEIHEDNITANQYPDLEPESQGREDSTSFGALSPASERILQKANITVLIPSPEMKYRFIQRHDSNEDVMEEIKSTFKFARKENAQCPDKSSNIKSNGHVPDTSHTFSQHRNTFSLPLRLTSDLTNDEPPHTPDRLKDSMSSMPRDDTGYPTSKVDPNAHFSPAFHEDQCDTSQAFISQENSQKAAGPVNKEIVYSDFDPHYQPTTSSKEGGLDSLPAISFECPNQSLHSANTAVPRISQAITTPDTNLRRSQILQKVTPSNRIRIKQPFPEVSQTSSSRNHQSNTQAPNQDHGQCERYFNKQTTITEPSISEVDVNYKSVSVMPIDNDTGLRPRLSATECLDSAVSRRHISNHQNLSVLPNEPAKTSILAEEEQDSDQELTMTNNKEAIGGLAHDSSLDNLASHYQQNRPEELQKTAQVFNPQNQGSMDSNTFETTAVNGVISNSIQSDNLLPTSENEVSRKPASRPSSPQSQKQLHGSNLPTPSWNNVSGTFGHLQQTSKPGFLQYHNDARVKKSKFIHIHRREMHRYSSPPNQQPRLLSKIAQAQQTLIKHSEEVEDILEECQHQKEVIQSQQSELEKFKAFDVEKTEKIQALELEKKAQKAKIKKFEQLSGKYKDHMNEVVTSQKQLLRESQRIRKVETDAKVFQEAYTSRESHIKKLESLLGEVKEFRGPAEKLLAAQQENGALIKLIQESSKTNELLQSDLDKNVIELGRKRHAASQLQKQLNAQAKAHKDLIEHLKNTRSGIIDDLTRESGILARILHSESSAQEKLEQLSLTVNDMKSHEQDFQPTLVKLIESLSMRLGNMLQTAENNSEILRESHFKHFMDLKERVDQACHDKKTEAQLNDVITRLRETNAALSSSLSTREAECKGMTTRIADLELDLTSSRGLLSTKCDELEVALALPKDNPQLRERCHDLERRNTALEGQVDMITRETTSTREELATLRKKSLETEKQFHQLQDGYNEAQNSLKKFAEEKIGYISNAKLDIEKARQDVAKSSMAAKNELIMRNDALVKNLEQRRSEAESQVMRMKDELQRMQAERDTYSSSITQLQHDVSVFQSKTIQQSMHIERLEIQSISQAAFKQQETSLECARGEIAELKAHLEYVKNNATEGLKAAVQMTKEIGDLLRQVDDLEHENESLKAHNLVLQDKYNAISTAQFAQKANIPHLQEEAVTAVKSSLEIEPPNCAGQVNEIFNVIHAAKSHSLLQSPEVQRSESGPILSTPATTKDISWNLAVMESGLDPNTTTPQFTDCNTVTNHPGENSDASSFLQLPHKALKVANRRTHQPSKIGPAISDKNATAYNLQQSTAMLTSHTTHETTIRVQTPGEEIIPFSNFSPIQSHPPISLTDVSPIMDNLEVINKLQDLHKTYATARGNKHCGSSPGYLHVSRNADISNPAENLSPETTTSQYKLSYHPPNGSGETTSAKRKSAGQIPIVKRQQQEPVVANHNGSAPRKLATALKSALKKPANVMKATNNFPTTSKPTAVLKNMPSGRGVNKNQRLSAPELGYKRVASGQAIKPKSDNTHFNDMIHGQVHAHHQSSQYQSTNRISDKSPLMLGPRRNERKRSAAAFLGGEQAPKLSKTPRTSLHFKSATTVIPNSPTVPNSQGNDGHTHRLC